AEKAKNAAGHGSDQIETVRRKSIVFIPWPEFVNPDHDGLESLQVFEDSLPLGRIEIWGRVDDGPKLLRGTGSADGQIGCIFRQRRQLALVENGFLKKPLFKTDRLFRMESLRKTQSS